MPELPEVHTATNSIRPFLINQRIRSIHSLNNYNKVFATHSVLRLNNLTANQKINRVWRRGKFIVLNLDSGYLLFHLRMTGRIQPKILNTDNAKHFTVKICLTNNTNIYFKDYRKFGRVYFYQSLAPIESKLGPEPLSDAFNKQYLFGQIKARKRMIKPLLLDQSFIAGLGNIYVDESLWLSKIHPKKAAFKISSQKLGALHSAIQFILQQAIEHNGTTIINFAYGENSTGSFKDKLNVFGRAGEPCLRCETNIKKTYVSQRGTHFCPRCQRK
jgi:formamidopyrimidine-DNA glycosylase